MEQDNQHLAHLCYWCVENTMLKSVGGETGNSSLQANCWRQNTNRYAPSCIHNNTIILSTQQLLILIGANATAIPSETEITEKFVYYFHCTGQEKNLTGCRLTQVDNNILCNSDTVAGVTCEMGNKRKFYLNHA